MLAMDYPQCPFAGPKYLIELDRQGSIDAVFYDCNTADFKSYISSFGFKEAQGSFSDISFLMSEWNICAVNLSIGYRDEHTYAETLHFDDLFETVRKVKNMLKAKDIPTFIYEEVPHVHHFGKLNFDAFKYKTYDYDFGAQCEKCKMSFNEYEAIPVKTANGFIKFYCPDCVADKVAWCNVCSEAFEILPGQQTDICLDCLEEKEWNS